jgi:outer membrane lipoprotein-sorting protein
MINLKLMSGNLRKYKTIINIWILSTSLVVFTNNIYAQTADEVVKKVLSNFEMVKDFSADMKLKIDISYLNAPEKSGKIFFKIPNKTKIDIDGFSMLPKQGTGNFIAEVLKGDNTIIANGEEKIDGIDCISIKVIPNNPKNDVAIMTMWVSLQNWTVIKTESITKKSGSFIINLKYTKVENKFMMPSQVKINFSVPEFSLPKTMTGDFKDNKENKPKSKDGKTDGIVNIIYSNYFINKGIKDDVFKDKN